MDRRGFFKGLFTGLIGIFCFDKESNTASMVDVPTTTYTFNDGADNYQWYWIQGNVYTPEGDLFLRVD